MQEKEAVKIAYFSMEIALDESIPTYSGGLGILAGDTLRSAADLGAPITAVTLVYRKGYFRQHLDELGQYCPVKVRTTSCNCMRARR